MIFFLILQSFKSFNQGTTKVVLTSAFHSCTFTFASLIIKPVVMPFTDFCDVFASAHEDGFNRLIEHVSRQRPSLFHYGTPSFVNNPKLLCCPPENIHPEVLKRNNPLVSAIPYLPIPGYPGNAGLEYNFSLVRLQIDFEPTNVFNLPAELGTKLPKQAFAIKALVCGGIACPDDEILDKFTIYPEPYRPDLSVGKPTSDKPRDNNPDFNIDIKTPRTGLPFNRKNIHCFQLGLYVVLNFARETYLGEPVLGIKLQNLELVDIKPDGLENSLECYIKTTLRLGILPQLRVSFNALVFEIGDFINIVPTPISGNVPFNPAVQKDTVSVLLNLQTP